MASIDEIATGKYIALTTFRKDGTPVVTPVWFVREGDHLLVTTDATSGKVKRARANPSALVAPCDMRGRSRGPAVAATIELAGPEETQRITREVVRRYGLMGRLLSRRGGREARQGLIVTTA